MVLQEPCLFPVVVSLREALNPKRYWSQECKLTIKLPARAYWPPTWTPQ